jgi:hypothetical protein
MAATGFIGINSIVVSLMGSWKTIASIRPPHANCRCIPVAPGFPRASCIAAMLRLAGTSVVSFLIGISVTTILLYKKHRTGHGENLRGGHHETPSIYPALLGRPEHDDGLLCRAVSFVSGVCVSGLWWLRGRGCVGVHRTDLGRTSSPPSPRPLPRISLWWVYRAWAVASVSECRAWDGLESP